MEYQFDLPDGYTFRDALILNRSFLHRNRLRRWANLLFRGLLISVGIGFVMTGLAFLDGGYAGETSLPALAVPPLLIGLLWIVLGLFQTRLSALSSRRAMLRYGHIHTTLNENGVVSRTGKGTEIYPYSAFTEAWAFQDYWLLLLDKRHAKVLPRAAMTKGDPALFPSFWLEKTGKAIQNIR